MQQQRLRWDINQRVEKLSEKSLNLLHNEAWGVFMNVRKYRAGIDRCVTDDVTKCEFATGARQGQRAADQC